MPERTSHSRVAEDDAAPSPPTEPLLINPTVDPPIANPTALERSLNTHRDHAFSALTHIHHLPPTVATFFSSLYRTSLGAHTVVRAYAESNGFDAVW
ncbi:MAG: hypothetical protein Q9169_006686, partial [Polycauliona sp. 2 TL-2023]